MDFIKREIMSHDLKIAGGKYPAIFNYRAIALAEDVSGVANGYTLARLEEDYDENGNLKRIGTGESSMLAKAGLQAREIIGLAYGMMKAAGVNVDVEDLEASISPSELSEIIKQLKEIIKHQDIKAVVDDSKNK